MSDDVIQVDLKSDSSGFVSSFNKAADATGHLQKGLQTVVGYAKSQVQHEMAGIMKWTAGVGASLLGAGIRAKQGLSAFGAYQTSMANVSTVADTAQMSMGKMSAEVRKLATSGQVIQTVDQLSEGLYNIVSSGYQGKQALDVLSVAAKGASAGLTDTVTAGTAITQILNAYGMSASKAADVSDILFQSVNVGVFSFEQLANTVGDWASVASTLNVPIGEATAALSAMTAVGAQADEASTQLRMTMLAFVNPSDDMAKAVQKLGFSSAEAMVKQLGLGGAIKAVVGTTNGSTEAVQGLFNEVRALNGVLQLTGEVGAKKLADFTGILTDRQRYAGSATIALAKQLDTGAAAGKRLSNEFHELTIELGQTVAPAAAAAAGGLSTVLHAVNSLPAPLRTAVSILQLFAPFLTLVGGALAARAIQIWAVHKAFSALAGVLRTSAIFSKLPGADAAATWLTNYRGLFPSLIGFFKNAAMSSDGFRAALARVATQGAVMVGGMTLITIAIVQAMGAMNDAKKKAKDFVDAITLRDKGNESYDSLNKKIQDLTATVTEFDNRFGHRNVFSKLAQGVGAGAQFLNPFDRNTISQDYEKGKASEAATKALIAQKAAIVEMQAPGETLTRTFELVAKAVETTGLDVDKVGKLAQKSTDDFATMAQELIKDPTATSAGFIRAAAAVQEDQAAMDKYRGTVDEVRKAEEDAARVKQQEIDLTHSYSLAQLELAGALAVIADNTNTAKDRMDAYGQVLGASIGKNDALRNAQAKMGEAVRNLGDNLYTYGAAFDPLTEKGAKVQEALSGASEAVQAVATATYASTNSFSAANNAVAQYVSAIISVAQQAGLSQGEIMAMIQAMGLTPDQISTLVSLPGADEALAALLAVNYGLDNINGRVVSAGVVISVTTTDNGMIVGSADSLERQATTANDAAATMASVKDQIATLLDGFKPKNLGAKGGGGGGGGAAKYHPTAAQMAQAAKTIALPVINQLTGALYDASIRVWSDQIEHGAMMDLLTRGVMRVGAGEILAAAKSGEDPTSKLESAATNWSRLTKLVGSATADMIVDMYDSADAFGAAVDRIAIEIDKQRSKEDYLYKKGKVDTATYRQQLMDRLQYLEEYSSEWISIMDQIDQLDQEAADKAKTAAQTHEDAAKTIAEAYKSLYDSIADPIKQATSLIGAFSGQLDVSSTNITGFFNHMKEGTKRWIDTITQLKSAGLDQGFLMDLIKEGPKSLGLATALLGMGSSGISFVNGALGDIASMTGTFGTGIASGQVGAPVSNVNSNNVTVSFGDTVVSIDATGGITTTDVQGMLAQAFKDLAAQVITKVRK